MKPVYQKLIGCPDEGLVVKEIHGDACNCPWHCHAEIELILTIRSHGYRIVGDNIQSLQPRRLGAFGAEPPACLSAHRPLCRPFGCGPLCVASV